jgi:soluble lytic murein transglycosylase
VDRLITVLLFLVALLWLPSPVGAADALLPLRAEARYAAAIDALRHGDPGPAIRELGAEEAFRSHVGDHLRLLYAEALLRRGDLTGARRAAESVAEGFPGSRVASQALLFAASAATRAGDEARHEALLRQFLASHADSPNAPAVLYQLGLAFEARAEPQKAAQTYRELTLLAPASGYAGAAADRLAALARGGTVAPALSPEERLTRAERLLRSGVLDAASTEADALAAEAREPGFVVRALQIVMSAAQRLRRYGVAARAAELAIARTPPERKPALRLELGRLLHRAGNGDRAVTVLAAIPDTAPLEAAEAAFLRGRILEGGGKHAEAATQFERTVSLQPGREVAGAALWRLGWMAYLRGEQGRAGKQWARVLEIPGGRALAMPAAYWSGRAREGAGAKADAERLYRRILAEAPRSYYGLLAGARMNGRGPGPREGAAIQLPADPVEGLQGEPRFGRVATLQRLGLAEEAAAEMEDLVLSSTGDRVKLYALSGVYQREERYHLALRILRRHFGEVAASGDASLPRAFWEMTYPFGWQTEVTQAASRWSLDPFLVAAIVREESNFFPLARSPVGARGLMQLMPDTARPMAALRGLAFNDGAVLDEPAPNIDMGTAFLAAMLKEFPDPRLATAAYNAGPGRVREWWRTRRTDDLEVWVEQIPFDETRFYVKRVMVSWAEYRRLYADSIPR